MYGIWNKLHERWVIVRGEVFATAHLGVATAQLREMTVNARIATEGHRRSDDVEIRTIGEDGLPT